MTAKPRGRMHSRPAPPSRPASGAPVADTDDARPASVRRWALWAICGWFTGMLFAQIVLGVALAAAGHSARDLRDGSLPLWFELLGAAGLWIGFIGVPWLVTRLPGGGGGLRTGLGFRARAVDAWGVVLGVVCQYALVPAISLPWLILLGREFEDLDDPARDLISRAGDSTSKVLLLIVVVIGAPLAEEILFRGFLQRGLLRWVPAPLAIAVSSVLFALTHFQLLQFPALAAFGAVLGVLAYRTGRLGPSIATHMGFNAVTATVLLLSA